MEARSGFLQGRAMMDTPCILGSWIIIH